MVRQLLNNVLRVPVLSRVKRAFSTKSFVDANSKEVVELSPACVFEAMPVISLPDEITRIYDVDEYSTFELQHRRLKDRQFEHGATQAFRINDAVLAAGAIYTRYDYISLQKEAAPSIFLKKIPVIDNAQLCTNFVIERYFGHWLRDGLLLELLAHERELMPLSFVKAPWVHEPGYRELCALEGAKMSSALVRNCWIVDDRGVNKSWIRRFNTLRERVRRTPGVIDKPEFDCVYLRRGQSGVTRRLTNEAEIENILEDLKFKIIDPELMTPSEIVTSLRTCKIAVSVEGSALNHAQIGLPSGSVILSIQPPYRFNALHRHFCDAAGLRFAYVVGDPDYEGFKLDADRLKTLIDLIHKEI